MRRCSAALILLLVACQPSTPTLELGEAELADLEAYDMEVLQALGNGDWESYFSYLAPDIEWMVPNGGWVRGEAAVRDFVSRFESMNGIEVLSRNVDASGDLAYRTVDYVMRADLTESDEELVYPGKMLTVYRRQADGTWLVQTEIWNANPAN